jgi:NADPH-dependent curcumin reductase CurA
MRIIISILFISVLKLNGALAYDPTKLQADLDLIKDSFMVDKSLDSKKKAPKKKLTRAVPDNNDNQIENLEDKYFDSISSKLAAPKRSLTNKRKRAR